MSKTLSVVMSVRNCQNTIGQAMQSILDQTFHDWQMIVVNDGSEDRTPEILASYQDPRIRVLSHLQSRGVAARVNEAVGLVNSEFIARMDGDDISYPKRFEEQLSFLHADPSIDLVSSSITLMDRDGNIIGQRINPENHEEICAHPWLRFPMPQPTWMGRTSWFKANPYLECYSEDYDLLFRTYRKSRFANIPRPLLYYRENLTLRKSFLSRNSYRSTLFYHGSLADIAKGVSVSLAMNLVDFFAICSGLKYHVLRHRISKLPSAE